ncbi:hypothetical protein IU500_24780 [Nocardia terpenica]|uniref:hypothetical protein n=1 Tax=Nocardia terpenica TaxID=455432 RepID=UPI0018941BE1|nr:hypothetical protein [Nocardia terpenica]MBF6064718.1 hypothetical protein [Nocardia terpenica]MBF6107233.1 hypothetical protein [Nocardia terpenica]MBF6114990.1 hypothetical protein [Nocardia terpenica]MBF6122096.1 hypothetical protein [Nocardia terpenica]MBF6154479.1 hypothetical protein [Nocardia terpenica]
MSSDQNRSGAVVTSTTARIHGVQDGRISVGFARTPEAFVSLAWGGVGMRFLSANAAQGVLEGFAAARAHLMGLDYESPLPPDGADRGYAQSSVLLSWERRTPYAVVKRDAYSQSRQRTVRWVELHMGPVTWQIVDRAGYDSVVGILRDAHRTAVGVCLDGGKYRADPTKDDYRSPDLPPPPEPELGRRRRKTTDKPASARKETSAEGAYTATLIGKAAAATPSAIGTSTHSAAVTPAPSGADASADLDL